MMMMTIVLLTNRHSLGTPHFQNLIRTADDNFWIAFQILKDQNSTYVKKRFSS